AIPRLNEVSIDTHALLFTLALTIATGLLFGFIPALQLGRIHPIHVAELRRAASSKLSLRFLRTAMVTGQFALTLVLLLGAGLLIKSFLKLANTDLGFDPANV